MQSAYGPAKQERLERVLAAIQAKKAENAPLIESFGAETDGAEVALERLFDDERAAERWLLCMKIAQHAAGTNME